MLKEPPRLAHLEYDMNTARNILLATALGLAIGATAMAADQAPLPAQASIPFIKAGKSIRDWQADGREGLWVQDIRRQWYYAKLQGPCLGLDFATGIGFDTGPGDSLDRFSAVVVPREDRCQIFSLTKSDTPPPVRKKKRKAEVAPASEAEVSGK
jgi:Family of unknown function (DUF6491)